jgi:hypothetical protein
VIATADWMRSNKLCEKYEKLLTDQCYLDKELLQHKREDVVAAWVSVLHVEDEGSGPILPFSGRFGELRVGKFQLKSSKQNTKPLRLDCCVSLRRKFLVNEEKCTVTAARKLKKLKRKQIDDFFKRLSDCRTTCQMPHRNASRNSGFRKNRAEKFFNFKYHNKISGKLMNSFTYIFSTYKFFKYLKYFKYLRTHIKMHTRTYIQIDIQKSIQYLKYHKYFKYFKCFDCSCLLSSLGTIYLISVEKPRTYSRTDFKNHFFKYLKYLRMNTRTHTRTYIQICICKYLKYLRTHTRTDIQICIQKLKNNPKNNHEGILILQILGGI